MREPQRALRPVRERAEREYVEFWPAGVVATGRFRCTGCGGAANVKFVMPRCATCGERLWEREQSSAYAGVS
jgi:hypothetical protein